MAAVIFKSRDKDSFKSVYGSAYDFVSFNSLLSSTESHSVMYPFFKG
jgi:hypothetical protein